jgi:hypothetical protein
MEVMFLLRTNQDGLWLFLPEGCCKAQDTNPASPLRSGKEPLYCGVSVPKSLLKVGDERRFVG